MTTATRNSTRADWKSKVVSLDRAIAMIRPGEHIYLSAGSAAPLGVYPGLCAECAPLGDNTITHLMTLGDAPYADKCFAHRFRHNALFIGANTRRAIAEGRGDYTPVFLSEIPALIRARRIPIDVAIISLTPPDDEGYCSFGTHVDLAPAACEVARLVIGQINANLPRVHSPDRLHVNDIHAFVEIATPIPLMPAPKARAESEQIARHIADLIPDGATLQLGIGGIPDSVLRFLKDRKDLGIHTEMFSDGVVDLVERGVINCRRKNLNPGKIIASFAFGSQRTYDFMRDNPLVELRPVDYTNDPFVIAQNDNMIAINTCLQIDLTGQVCSDSIGEAFYSGIGGQVDFIRGAARSRGGKPIIALPSTATDGMISRIVPRLDDGAGVVTTRGDVHWIVTEYGAVNLHGLNVRERAMALISLAHPKFRPWLLSEAKRRRLVYADQVEPPLRMPLYPRQIESHFTTRSGERVLIRPVKPTDESLLRDLFYGLSRETIYQRFFGAKKYMPHENLQRFCTIDYDAEMTLVATVCENDLERVVGWALYSAPRAGGRLSEVAFVVADDWQGRGVGTQLLRRLIEVAEARGVRGFVAQTLATNSRMLRVFEKCGYPVEERPNGDVVEIHIAFDQARPTWADIDGRPRKSS